VDGIRPHGTYGRWLAHVKEAMNGKDSCIYLNNAIRKYGEDGFIVHIITECPISELDKKERYYIKYCDSLAPAGYNITTGGRANFTFSKSVLEQISKANKGIKKSASCVQNNRIAQLGKRYSNLNYRKNPKNKDLPKYIYSTLVKGKLVGYKIGFPIGIDSKKFVYKGFNNLKNPKEALDKAIKYLDELKIKYKHVEEETQNRKRENADKILAKIDAKKKKLPEFIQPVMHNTVVIGYKVTGFLDSKGIAYPEKIVTNRTCNYSNLKTAKLYLKSLEITKQNETFVPNKNILSDYETQIARPNKILPIYIQYYKWKTTPGFCVYYSPDKISKRFLDRRKTMEQKFNLAVEFLKDIYFNKLKLKPTIIKT